MEFRNGFFDELLRSPAVCEVVDEATERIAARARTTAPSEEGKRRNEYRDGIVTAGKMQERYVGLVIATNERSMAIEATTGNLARALKGAGRGR